MEAMEYAKTALEYMACGAGAYTILIGGSQLLFHSSLLSKRIMSQSQLNRVAKREAKKLGLDPRNITAIFDGETPDNSIKIDERYVIETGNDFLTTENSFRHELCHAAKDCDNVFNQYNPLHWLRYLFIEEPRATLYGCFGIKLF